LNILIINAHSSLNKGDAGIILSMIDSLKKNVPNCEIRIKSRFSKIDKSAYNVHVSDCLANISIDPKTPKWKKIISATRLLSLLSKPISPSKETEDYEWADVVVSCGGGFLLSHGFSAALLQHLVQIKAAIDFKKPVVIYSQSIGPFYNKVMQKIAKTVLDKVDKIFIRETISEEWLTEINSTNASKELVPDSAFCMNSGHSTQVDDIMEQIQINHKGPFIGVTVRDWNFPEVENKALHRKNYVESIRALVKFVEEEYQAKVLLMPQVLGPNPFNDDRIISREILSGLDSTNAELLDYNLTPRELKYFYSKMDMFVGTRMHSNIFSLSNIVPTVAINYEHKTRGIMNMLELSDYVIEINDITPSELIEKTKKCWKNKISIRDHLEVKIPEIIHLAETPARYIQKYNT
jgi:colanic acid/amylovoran biosynthesis protein